MSPARCNFGASRGGFALPLVVLLALVSAVLIGVTLERFSAQGLTVQRHVERYSFHHSSQGIQEAINAWVRSNGNAPVAAALGDDGLAFTLEPEGGGSVAVYLRDGQGLMLGDLSGLSPAQIQLARRPLARLVQMSEARARGLVRQEGPMAVSVNTAPEDVLTAIVESVVSDGALGLVRDIMSGRALAPITPASLVEIYGVGNIPAQERAELTLLLTAEPVLWEVVAEAGGPSAVYPPPPKVRYQGLMMMSNSAVRSKANGAMERNSAFLTWARAPQPSLDGAASPTGIGDGR